MVTRFISQTRSLFFSHLLLRPRIVSFSILGLTFLLCFIYFIWSISYQFKDGHACWVSVILSFKLIVELIAIFYMICFLFSSVFYLLKRKNNISSRVIILTSPPAAVLYFCCNDLDYNALLSLVKLEYPGELRIIVHDDSPNKREHAHVDSVCEDIKRQTNRDIMVLRRQTNEGGKPAAVQYVLEKTHHLYEFFLLADNDSYAHKADVLSEALSRFTNEKIAVVQCRNRTRQLSEDSRFAKTLAWSIDIFDVFMRGFISHFWTPFVGHNAVLRTKAIMSVGGMTPGFFADDIDLSVRLHDEGYEIRYCSDLELSETHPRNYRAFCMRTSKWATGCLQVLRAHTIRVLCSREFSFVEKVGFFLFCGFYIFQAAIFLYLMLICIVLPFITPNVLSDLFGQLFIGSIITMTVFGPASVYLWKNHRKRFWSALVVSAGAYGSTDFYVIRGLLNGMLGKHRWIPTNSVDSDRLTFFTWAPYVLGFLLLIVPLTKAPSMLIVPTTILFASKFLFIPAIARHYRETPLHAPSRTRYKKSGKISAALLSIIMIICFFLFDMINPVSSSLNEELSVIEIRDDKFVLDGKEFEVRGIHYSPWPPGSGPRQGILPSREEIERDFELITKANANTILTFHPPDVVLKLAQSYSLKVIYAFNIEWWRIEQGSLSEQFHQVDALVKTHKESPALFAWMLGNEVPEWVITKAGKDAVSAALSTLHNRIRSIDPGHPITHGNWPMTRDLDLDVSLDFVSFNLYPYYPPEVAATGFGRYIERELKPTTNGRPLLISEFGINTLESTPEGQADTLRRCWEELRRAGAAGGIVFEFADGWWKNYNNPVRPPNWWHRKPDSKDHLSHDNDPEEHYGIVTGDRKLKPGYEAVRFMFAKKPSIPDYRKDILSILGLGIVIAVVTLSIILYRRSQH